MFDAFSLGQRRLPVIQAAEAAECGLACLAMIARYHGHDVDLNGLRQRLSLSLTGAPLRALMALAHQLGFTARALRVEVDALPGVRGPAVLHWDLNHFSTYAVSSGVSFRCRQGVSFECRLTGWHRGAPFRCVEGGLMY